jgi:ABC-2 type transport system ATP-binding protein
MSAATPALALEDLSKHFGRIHAVRRLSLSVEPGQMAGFLGPNGAGKSTTLYMIPRLVRPSAGHIRIFGVDLWRDFKRAIGPVGVLVETPAFYEYLSGRKNLELTARVRRSVGARELEEILERIGLADRQHDRVGTYSLGMKQRLGIGWALLGRPRLLVLDEPTNGMDPEGTREILGFLRERVQTDGLTVFLSSHLLHEVEEYCDTVFVINHGRLVASGNVKDLLRPHERVVRVVFRDHLPPRDLLAQLGPVCQVTPVSADSLEITLAGADAAWLNERLLQAGCKVAALVPKQRTLKEFFLAITGEHNHE